MRFRETLWSLLFFIFIAAIYNIKVIASEQFITNYDLKYQISASGEALVSQLIQIVNKEKDIIATSYSLTIKNMGIYDVKATTKNNNVKTEIMAEGKETVIKSIFEEAAIGQGKKTELNITYKTKDLASKIGEVWNVNIPKVNLLETTDKYEATLVVPKSLGPEIFVSPQPLEKLDSNTETIYRFTKEGLEKTGITAAFGKYQVLNFKLNYKLKNESYLPTVRDVALPPDIQNTQQVAYKSINPQPEEFRTDEDGNTYAVYELKGKQELSIDVIGTARILGQQIKPEYGGEVKNLPADLVEKYTKPQKYWDVDNDEIQEIAKGMYDPNKNISENAQAAYLYVTNNLKYDFDILQDSFVQRKGAVNTLKDKENIGCMEFTDLFISIVRAMGIPARELNGYAITNDTSSNTPVSIKLRSGDVLHSWAEFYDPKYGWVPVDPTWGQTSGIDYFTKLDTNHFVFAIKGLNSEYPLPAGVYKITGTEKQVEVDFAQDITESDFAPVINLYNAPDFNFLDAANRYYLKNDGLVTVYLNKDGNLHTLIPGQSIIWNAENGDTTVTLKDATGKEHSQVLKPKDGNWNKEDRIIVILSAFALVLVLYVIFYLIVNRPKGPQIIFHRLLHRLRGQDQ